MLSRKEQPCKKRLGGDKRKCKRNEYDQNEYDLRVAIVMKKVHDHGNSHKGKQLIRAGLQVQRFSPLSSWQEAWQHGDRHGAGEEAECSTSCSKSDQKTISQAARRMVSKPNPTVTTLPPTKPHLLQQGHTF